MRWNDLRQRLTNETLDMLRVIASLTLETDSSTMSDEEVQELYTTLQDLYFDVNHSNLPGEAKNYLRKHIEILMQALREYQVRGSVVFVDAYSFAQSVYSLKHSVAAAQGGGEFQGFLNRLGLAWAKVRERVEDVQMIVFVADMAQKLLS